MELHFDEIEDTKMNKPITYDDILAKLNVKIVDGKMQYITPIGITNAHFKTKNTTVNKVSNLPIVEDKTSYIYNKYFKKEISNRSMNSPPKTREEYNKRLAEEMRKHELMRQAKSKKLKFYSNNNYARTNMIDPDKLFRINLKR